MGNIPPPLQPLARRTIRILQNAFDPFTTVYPPLTSSQTQHQSTISSDVPPSPSNLPPSPKIPSRSTSPPPTMPLTPTPQMSITYASSPPPSPLLRPIPQPPQMEIMYVPTPSSRHSSPTQSQRLPRPSHTKRAQMGRVSTFPSRPSSPPLLVGSEYIFPIKTRLSPASQARATPALQEAVSQTLSRPWPTIEEKYPTLDGKHQGKSGKGKRGEMKDSGLFVKELTEEEKMKKEEIARKWKGREERSISGRRRVEGGLEDVEDNNGLERMWDMRPTLERYGGEKVEGRRSYFKEDKMAGKGAERPRGSSKDKDREGQNRVERPRERGREMGNAERKAHRPTLSLAQITRENMRLRHNRLERVEEREEPSMTPRKARSKPAFRYKEESDDDTLPFLPRK